MQSPPPRMDKRDTEEIVEDIRVLAPYYVPELDVSEGRGVGVALIRIFAGMQGLIVDRLNKVPEKNFVAFLDMLGIRIIPAQPARAAVTFHLSAGARGDMLIPEKTQVAAGEIIFETEKNVVATASTLKEVYSVSPAKDSIFNHTTNLNSGEKFEIFNGTDNVQKHVLYMGHDDLFNFKKGTGKGHTIIKLCIRPALGIHDLSDAGQWCYWGEGGDSGDGVWIPLKLLSIKKTDGAAVEVSLWKAQTGASKEREICGRKSRWICCCLKIPIKQSSIIPVFGAISVKIKDLDEPDAAFHNDIPLNLTEPFHPFGKVPRIYDIFYIADQECFSKKGEKLLLKFTLEDAGEPKDDLILSWEYWNGSGWQAIKGIQGFEIAENEEINRTFGFDITRGGVSFTSPGDFQTTIVGGQENYWIRVRVLNGGYGNEEFRQFEEEGGRTWRSITQVMPPRVKGMKIKIKEPGRWDLLHCLTCNNLDFGDVTEENKSGDWSFEPFQPLDDEHQTLYLGFDEKITKGPISIFFSLEEQELSAGDMPEIEWYYYSQDGKWVLLEVSDDTENLTRAGVVSFFVPADFARTSRFGVEMYWIRAVDTGDWFQTRFPEVSGICPNTVFAIQAESIRDEILGSSDGTADQKFWLAKTPVISEEIWVNETSTLCYEEKKTIMGEDGSDSVMENKDDSGKTREIRVRWQPVEDFLDSSVASRHYVVERITGEVRFGDGVQGMIPPVGRDSIRATYQIGGGRSGNVGASEISTMKTSIPYVDRVTNHEAAGGGSDTEMLQAVFERGPYLLRHRNRAVTEEDFERLARAASTDIARTICFAEGSRLKIIIIPGGTEDMPVPSQRLLKKVKNSLLRGSLNTISPDIIDIREPTYMKVGVAVEVVPESIDQAAPLEKEIMERLKRFFHPLTGGYEERGWEFGRDVHISDVYALIGSIRGVDYMENLMLNDQPNDLSIREFETVCSGEHRIQMKVG
jgi:hypothetical protein